MLSHVSWDLRHFGIYFWHLLEKIDIPRRTVYRLSHYQRSLQRFRERSVEMVSSEDLAAASGVKPTQLRKDLGHVGQFGTRGLGYSVSVLSDAIAGGMGRAGRKKGGRGGES